MTIIVVLFVALLVCAVVAAAYLTTVIPLFGLPVASGWSDLSGAFTAAAAIFTGITLIGVVFSLRHQAHDGTEQRHALEQSLAAQKDALHHLSTAARALKDQVASLERRADAAETQLALQLDERRIARLRELRNRFLNAGKPGEASIAELQPSSELAQDDVRRLIPDDWSAGLRLLLRTLHAMIRTGGKDSDIGREAEAIIEELRERISKQEKVALFLAELPMRAPTGYGGSQLARLLRHFQLFPYIENRDKCLERFQMMHRVGEPD
ncbi:hypothetical protein [Paracoccus denitrificans]|uniref:hypothetical protein n=1 Tax=Paracoccus denitrificans TaxID=266 RepID=UPI000CEC2818|nr:hypothetical protein [Paracoccus denitrificans]